MFEKVFGRTKPVEKAMDYEVDRYLDGISNKRTYMHIAERGNLFKSYLADRLGEEISITEIAKDMRVSTAQASRILTSLISNKEVVRHGSKNHYSYTVSAPEVLKVERQRKSGVKEKVLKFLATNQNVLITQDEIARGSGVTQPQASVAIRELVMEGIVVKSDPTREGTLYQVNSSPNAHLRTAEDIQRSQSEEMLKRNKELYQAIDGLVWQFIRETRVTDILAFLTWLEMGANLKGQ